MEIYVARQPIFDEKMNVFGYELLYRKSMNNFYEGTDDSQSTAELINNAFLAMDIDELTSGTKGFINFSEDLLTKEVPFLLPKDKIVIEILERVEPTKEVVSVCERLKREGYILALDDFVFAEKYLPLIEVADIIKIEFGREGHLHNLIGRYKNKIKFLAEKVETREEYQRAVEMGYELFQGYFFSKPVIVTGKDIDGGLNINIISAINELDNEEPDYQIVTEIIERDLGISYKILKLANSVALSSRTKIYSLKQALVRLGAKQIKSLLYLIMFKDIQSVENKELVKNSLIRGRLMGLLTIELGIQNKYYEYFMSGLFSSIDIILNNKMERIVEELPLTSEVKDALLGNSGEITDMLNIVINYEQANWGELTQTNSLSTIPKDRFYSLYRESIKWVSELDY
ncbi:HDOD domain-containing protein [Bacillus sp. 31A1R]|uniref:HDOD domain-containing protein n=1 Tax=Robertmurraya mangrovi TaxID=3098077 RepID=A0ABU5J2E1_9BACI|nr:HDOD domain-containing protein [Bacillus sp. 31A1R]MDZ5473573.1 HDOD domain-containing protein [Bacillus sp. 31A1R]